MARGPRTVLFLSVEAKRLLAAMENKSGYVSALILQQAAEVSMALESLNHYGWKYSEIECACQALAGCHHGLGHGESLSERMAVMLEKAHRGNRMVSAVNWPKRVQWVKEDQDIARAILEIARAYWTGNSELSDKLRQGIRAEVMDRRAELERNRMAKRGVDEFEPRGGT